MKQFQHKYVRYHLTIDDPSRAEMDDASQIDYWIKSTRSELELVGGAKQDELYRFIEEMINPNAY
jgi:hypothetical protein